MNGLAVVRRPLDKFHVEGCVRSVFFVSDACAICTVCARSVLFVRNFYSCAICARFVSFVRDIYYSCAIFIIRARSVRNSCIICAQSVRDLCIFMRSSCARCFCRSRVRTPDHAARSFLQVPGSIPGSDRLCQASEIRGLCHHHVKCCIATL